MNVDTIPDIEVIEHLDFDAELPCKSVHHERGIEGHSGPAAYWQTGGCKHVEGLRCAGFVAVSRGSKINCTICHIQYAVGVIKWLPISAGE